MLRSGFALLFFALGLGLSACATDASNEDLSVECESSEDGDTCDYFGNREEGEECIFDWQCSADLGLLCRPIGYLDLGHGIYETVSSCLPEGEAGGLCAADDDCSEGLQCQDQLIEQTIHTNGYTYIEHVSGGRCE